MGKRSYNELSKRERQIMDILFRKKQATAAEVQKELPDVISYSAIRAFLRILEEKGFVKHSVEGVKYVFTSKVSCKKVMNSTMKQVLNTFFNNSVEQAVSALIEIDREKLDNGELDRLMCMIQKAKKRMSPEI